MGLAPLVATSASVDKTVLVLSGASGGGMGPASNSSNVLI
jgi:hypothetical protein